VELGRRLFYDARLSGNGQQSCSTCHEQARAFTDGKGRAVGSTGQTHPRGAMSLVNVAYASALTWGDRTKTRLEDQALVPMFGDHPVELGLGPPGTAMLARLRSVDVYCGHRGRTVADGPDRGVGHDNPNKSPIVKGFPLTAEQKADLIAFLNALTDNDLLNDTRFANPWTAQLEEAR